MPVVTTEARLRLSHYGKKWVGTVDGADAEQFAVSTVGELLAAVVHLLNQLPESNHLRINVHRPPTEVAPTQPEVEMKVREAGRSITFSVDTPKQGSHPDLAGYLVDSVPEDTLQYVLAMLRPVIANSAVITLVLDMASMFDTGVTHD